MKYLKRNVYFCIEKFEKREWFMRNLSFMTTLACLLLPVCFSTTGCQDKKPASATDSIAADSAGMDSVQADSTEVLIEETPMPKAADELFDDFVFNFAANRKLQMSRIAFPLPVYRGDKQVKAIDRKHWKMERFFMRQEYYTLIFDNQKEMNLGKDTAVAHVVVEKVYYEQERVRQYVFDRIGGLWMMTAIADKSLHKNQNASFLKFYGQFATDSAYQAAHLNNPVKFVGPDPDDDFSTMTGDIEPETWPAFAPTLPSGMIYNIIYGGQRTASNQKIFVIRGIANGLETELTFRRKQGEWYLTKLNM